MHVETTMNAANAANPKNKAHVELVGDTVLVITRTFAAPPELVFEAITKPEFVKRWYGCDVMVMTTCEIDLRVGGRWRYVLRAPDGGEHGFHGEYREIAPPGRLVSTENYEPIGPGHEMVSTVTLEARGARTLFTNHLQYGSKADRDGHLASGMETGMQESLTRLDDVAASLAR